MCVSERDFLDAVGFRMCPGFFSGKKNRFSFSFANTFSFLLDEGYSRKNDRFLSRYLRLAMNEL